jgi:hypothetical protein
MSEAVPPTRQASQLEAQGFLNSSNEEYELLHHILDTEYFLNPDTRGRMENLWCRLDPEYNGYLTVDSVKNYCLLNGVKDPELISSQFFAILENCMDFDSDQQISSHEFMQFFIGKALMEIKIGSGGISIADGIINFQRHLICTLNEGCRELEDLLNKTVTDGIDRDRRKNQEGHK